MRSDYEILGVDRSADRTEIKKAYFKMVRQFSPEKEPERFQEIRAAYERLTQESDDSRSVKELGLKMPEEPFAQVMLKQMETLIGHGDYEGAMATAEEAIRYFGEYEALVYLLAYSQQHAGHSGRAVRNYEKLMQQFPQKELYKRCLAFAYYNRGYTKKALAAFELAYAAGMRDAEFILEFALCCSDQQEYSRGIAVLLELVRDCDAGDADRSCEYLEAYMELYDMDYESGGSSYPEITHRYGEFVKKAQKSLREHRDLVEETTDFMVHCLREREDLPTVRRVLDEIQKLFAREAYPEMWTKLSNNLLDTRLQIDDRLGDEISGWYEAFIETASGESYDEAIVRFTQTEAQLMVLERLPRVQAQMKLIESEYPELYPSLHDFMKHVNRGNPAAVREKLLKDYDRLAKHIGGGAGCGLNER